MVTEMLWVSLEERSRTNSPCQRFRSQLFCKIDRYFSQTLYNEVRVSWDPSTLPFGVFKTCTQRGFLPSTLRDEFSHTAIVLGASEHLITVCVGKIWRRPWTLPLEFSNIGRLVQSNKAEPWHSQLFYQALFSRNVSPLRFQNTISRITFCVAHLFFFFQALNFLVECFGLPNDLFPFPSILNAGYPVFDLHLADVLFDVINT